MRTPQGAAGPVAVAMAENWAVYHYWSTTHLRYEVAVIELYDDTSARSMSLADAVLSNSSALVSSHDATAIKTLRCAAPLLCPPPPPSLHI